MGKYELVYNISNPEKGMEIRNSETMETFDVESRQDLMKIITLLNKEA